MNLLSSRNSFQYYDVCLFYIDSEECVQKASVQEWSNINFEALNMGGKCQCFQSQDIRWVKVGFYANREWGEGSFDEPAAYTPPTAIQIQFLKYF